MITGMFGPISLEQYVAMAKEAGIPSLAAVAKPLPPDGNVVCLLQRRVDRALAMRPAEGKLPADDPVAD